MRLTWFPVLCLLSHLGVLLRSYCAEALALGNVPPIIENAFLANVIGCFIFGAATSLSAGADVIAPKQQHRLHFYLTALKSWFCGSLTSWSTYNYNVLMLLKNNRVLEGVLAMFLELGANLVAMNIGQHAGQGILSRLAQRRSHNDVEQTGELAQPRSPHSKASGVRSAAGSHSSKGGSVVRTVAQQRVSDTRAVASSDARAPEGDLECDRGPDEDEDEAEHSRSGAGVRSRGTGSRSGTGTAGERGGVNKDRKLYTSKISQITQQPVVHSEYTMTTRVAIVWIAVEAIVAVLLIVWAALSSNPTSLAALLGPIGTFVRYKLGKRQQLKDAIPRMTLLVNVTASVLRAVVGVMSDAPVLLSGVVWFTAIDRGVCGCLSTWSTFAGELLGLPMCTKYSYFFVTLAASQILSGLVLLGRFAYE